MSARIPIVAVVGPTAVGKTALAIALARGFGGEIINADSRQVYVGMDIGTAKPTAAEQAAARHHLIDFRSPGDPISLGEYLPMAREAIDDIAGRGHLPILCGGTGQYVWALLEGWRVPQVAPDPEFRRALEERVEREGAGVLWDELRRRDPERAESIGRSNVRRIIRALEVLHATGDRTEAEGRSAEPPYDALIIGLTSERGALYDHIDRRFDGMMEEGLLHEAKRLADHGFALGEGPLSGVGYSQLGAHLDGAMTLEDAVARAKTQTHRLVRRQNTWFKSSDERIAWLDATRGLPVSEASRLVRTFLTGEASCDTIRPQRIRVD